MGLDLNQEVVNDTARLIMHRLVARVLARDPSLVDRAKASHARISKRFPGRTFVREWDDLLSLPPSRIRALLTRRDPEMGRLRVSSPFVITEGVDFTDYGLRRRIRRAAKKIVERGLKRNAASTPVV